MSTAQGNLRGVLSTLRNAGVFDSIQASDEGICVTRGQWTIKYWSSLAGEVKWSATNKDKTKHLYNDFVAVNYRTLLVEIFNSVIGHFPADEMETPAREVPAGNMGTSHIGRTVTLPWTFRGHEATITGVLESVKHDEYGTYFELENTSNHFPGNVYKCESDSTVIIHDTEETAS